MPEHCLFCDSKDIVYRNGYDSAEFPGLKVRFGVCKKHDKWPLKREAMIWAKIESQRKELNLSIKKSGARS